MYDSAWAELGYRLPISLELWCAALVGTLLVGIVLGFVRARLRLPVLRECVDLAQLAVRATPPIVAFFAVDLLSIFLRVQLPFGYASGDRFELGDHLLHLATPASILAISLGPWSASLFRDFFLAVEDRDRHGLIVPVALTVARIGPPLIAASFLLEPMFAWPGITAALRFSMSERDFRTSALLTSVYVLASAVMVLAGALALAFADRTRPDRLPREVGTRGRHGPFALTPVSGLALAAFAVCTIAALTANFAGNPNVIDQVHWMGYPLAPGVGGHPLGTDESGRDLLARVLVGLRTSGAIALIATLGAIVIATPVAFVPWVPWFGRREALLVSGIRPFGALLLLIVPIALAMSKTYSESMRTVTLIAAIALVSWPPIVTAMRRSGSIQTVLGTVVSVAGGALLLESTLSASRVGVQPPTPSLGNMLVNLMSNATVAPWAVFVPAGMLIMALLALYGIGDGFLESSRNVPMPPRENR